MTIYNINLGIGWASSGVEYAQLYRAKALRALNAPAKFIFFDFIKYENIQSLTSHLGFYDDEVIWLYQHFTDVKIAPSSIQVDDIIKKLNIEVTQTTQEDRLQRIYYDNNKNYLQIHLNHQGFVERVEYVSQAKLLKTEHYSYTLVFTEYFAPKDNQAQCYLREFYHEDGTVAYTEYVNEKENMYVFPNDIFYSKQELIGYFLQTLELSSQDVILLDRSKDYGQVILENKGKAKFGVIIHAEHYNASVTTEQHILWNNFYEYVFNNAHEVDFFITATDRQHEILDEQFKTYYNISPKIYTVPVGNLEQLTYGSERKPYSIITASRLAQEKHVDWLVKAVIEAKQTLPDLTFDIYGEGTQRQMLNQIIEQNQAQDYIRVLGHVKLDDVYKDYELFLSGSTSEGFGLTLMEAVGSGLGIVGFEVNYGNPTFIKDSRNGYLIPIDLHKDKEQDIISKLAQSVIQYFEADVAKVHQNSYNIAEQYTQQAVTKLWQQLLNEVQYD